MKHPDFDKAFAPTPEIVSLSIEAAFRKGEKAMKLRHKVTAMLSAAAVLLVVCAAAVFALPNEPQPDVVSQPKLVENAEINVIYYNPKGNYYHFEKDCSGMLGAEAHTFAEAMADEKKPCPVCVLRKVYATENGKYCHYDEHCSGMMNATVDTESNWYDKGKAYCPVCMEPNTWVATGDPYYHYDMACCGDAAVGATENAALELNCFPCPICASGIAPIPEPETYNGSISMDADGTVLELESHPMSTITPWVTAAPTPEPEEFNGEEQIVYHTEQGKYYHLNMHCSGMMNASAHPISDAEKAGKIPCPVCITELTTYSTVDPSLPDAETPFYDVDAVPDTVEETPAKLASDIFTNVFGVYLFDAFEEFEYVSTNSYGVQSTDGLLTEEIEFCFARDGWQFAPVVVTVESMDDKIQSGSICLFPNVNFDFDWAGFCESASPWFQKVCENVPATLDMFNAMDASFEDDLEAITQVYVYFDSETKPSVCTMDFATYFGSFILGFDINGDDVSLASMNYNVSKA